jgi:predicted ester cyclase
MPEGGPRVEGVVARAIEDRRSREVDSKAGDGDESNPSREDLRWIGEPAPGLDEDPDREGDEDDAVHQRRQDLGALVAEAPFRRARPSGEPHGNQRECQREVVREHVCRVGEEREAAGEQTADELDRREGQCEAEDDCENAAIPGSDGGEVGHGLRICVVMDVRELMKLEVDPAEVQAVYELWKQHSMAEDNRDIGGLLATLTDDCVYRIVGEEERWEGHEGATRFYTGLLTAFPDIDFQLTDIVVGPQGVCEEAHVTATHEGDWLGWEASGERVDFDVVIFFPWDRERRLFRGEKVYVHADGLRG